MCILHDVYLIDDISKNRTQFDFIVITPYSICVIESKYVTGNILVSDFSYKRNGDFENGNPAWAQVSKQKEILTNILQNSGIKYPTSNLFPDFIQRYVVYSNEDCTFTNTCENEIMHNNILHINSLVSLMDNLTPAYNNTVLDDKTCNKIAYYILQKHNEDALKKFYQNEIQKEKLQKNPKDSKRDTTNQILVPCTNPSCTGHFLLRQNSRDKSYFVGCSNFQNTKCNKKLSISEYAFKLLQQAGIKIYSWKKDCWHCHKPTTVYTYLLHYDLFVCDEKFKEYLSDISIGMGKVYSGNNRHNLPQLDNYLNTISPSRQLGIKWIDKNQKKDNHTYVANHCQHCKKFQGRYHTIDILPEDIQQQMNNGTLIGEDWSITCNHAGITPELLEKIFSKNNSKKTR